MTAPELLGAMVISVIWTGAYAQLLGMPVAWLRLRRTSTWEHRSDNVRRIDLLAEFMLGPTALVIAWGWLTLIVAALGGLGLSSGTLLVLMWGAPVLFVPWAVLRLDKDRFPQVVERARKRKLAKRAQGN